MDKGIQILGKKKEDDPIRKKIAEKDAILDKMIDLYEDRTTCYFLAHRDADEGSVRIG